MNRRKRLAAIVAGMATAVATALSAGFLLSPNAGAQEDVSAQAQALWTNPNTGAARWVSQNPNDSRTAVIRDRIAETPAGTWFTQYNPTGGIAAQVAAVVDGAAASGAAPTMVVYGIPNRDCGGASGGGAPNHDAYRGWIDAIANEIDGPAYIVIEPDVIAHDCYGSTERAQINASLAYAAQKLNAADPAAKVYIDAGNSAWLKPDEAARRLQAAGLQYADGFSLNVSNYRTTDETTAYAQQVRGIVGTGKGVVIDTSRNGNGPLNPPNPNDWCDPPGRAIGKFPTTATGVAGIDAYLWVKLPGEADGCAGAAGQFIPDLAYQLANNAGSGWPGQVEPTDPATTPTGGPTGNPTTGGPAGCTVHIDPVSTWNGGWQGKVSMTSAQAVNGWTVKWTWPSGQAVTSSWNTTLTSSGANVTAKDVGWNASVSAGQTKELFGFVASGSPADMDVPC
ncbi:MULTISPECIES: glycoside hydrolase family 6 protein [Glycomyces]|uniref:Glucanase n=2 Tax=Glycomyces TaxID=58113 RepID=A0A9X3PNT7_9ACTN|nr:glycoside hydrolase family 6 protein [Glycomyces lechevalierae]MDA1387078.1 glycoside hydrolase family 6 protein [Glycomyces lechevalierae]MDR7336893.1 endoglucanase [Glycomyces lechevalierae]